MTELEMIELSKTAAHEYLSMFNYAKNELILVNSKSNFLHQDEKTDSLGKSFK